MVALLVLLLLQQQQPIKDWEVHYTDRNPRTGRDELVAKVRGDEAVLIDIKNKIVEARNVEGEYHTDPKSEREKSELVKFRGGHGRLDDPAGLLTLREGVSVRLEDGTELETGAAALKFHKRWACPKCRKLGEAQASCAGCSVPLREKTFATLASDQPFTLRRTDPRMIVKGEGLAADATLRQLDVARKGFVEMLGRPVRNPRAAADDKQAYVLTRLSCDGPLTIREDPDDPARAVLVARERVFLRRLDPFRGAGSLACDSCEIRVLRGDKAAEAERVLARGNLDFRDDAGMRATAESAEWTLFRYDDGAVDEAVLAGNPWVTAEMGGRRIRAKTARIERINGKALFEGGVDAELPSGADPASLQCGRLLAFLTDTPRGTDVREIDAAEEVRFHGTFLPSAAGAAPKPLTLRCDRLHVLLEPGAAATEAREIEATGGVRIEGLASADGGGEARADRFVWDAAAERGLLEGRPLARLVQGENVVQAPLIVMEGRSILVLKGPKRATLSVPKEDGTRATCRVTCRGDLEIDSSDGLTKLRLHDRPEIDTGEYVFTARHMNVTLGRDGRTIESLQAADEVRVVRPKDGVRLFGERLRYEPATQAFALTGSPLAVAEMGGQVATQESIRLYEKADPETGKKVQYTHFRGGKAGFKVVIRP